MHLFAEDLTPSCRRQLGLFDPDGDRAEAVAKVKREINAAARPVRRPECGHAAAGGVYADPPNEYDICDVRGKMCF